jgi:hypothetical protein
VFLPDALPARFRRFWRHKATRREGLQPAESLFCSQSRTRISPRRPVRLPDLAGEGRLRPALPVPCSQAHGGDERLPGFERPVPGAEVRQARITADDDGVHAPERPGDVGEDTVAELLMPVA